MKRIMLFVALLASVMMVSPIYAGTAGSFDWFVKPISDYRNDDPHGQIFMNLNTFDDQNPSNDKYHMAEDWNLRNGDDCGAPLYAIGDGFVRDVQNNPDKDPTIGKSLIVRYTLPDGSQVDLVYWHVQDIYVSIGMNVQKNGDKIATIGNATSSYYPSGKYSCHLHDEMRKGATGLALQWNENSYLNPLTIPTALNYTSPSLFVDDRRYPFTISLPKSTYDWYYLSQYLDAPSSTAFVEYNGERYSLQRAVQANLIWHSIWEWNGSGWKEYTNASSIFFHANMTYAIWPFVDGAKLTILIPGHNYKTDRAKIDMIRAVSVNSNFKSVKPDTFKVYTSDQSFDYWYMEFTYNNGSGNQSAYVYQATLKSNPIVRYTIYYDPAIGNFTPWTAVDPNVLY